MRAFEIEPTPQTLVFISLSLSSLVSNLSHSLDPTLYFSLNLLTSLMLLVVVTVYIFYVCIYVDIGIGLGVICVLVGTEGEWIWAYPTPCLVGVGCEGQYQYLRWWEGVDLALGGVVGLG